MTKVDITVAGHIMGATGFSAERAGGPEFFAENAAVLRG